MNCSPLARYSLVVLLGFGAVACAGSPARVPSAAAPAAAPADTAHAAHAAHPPAAAAPARPRRGYTEADVRFLQHMIPHHAQALVLTAMVPERTTSTPIRLIADRIAVSQRDEIGQMQRWLREHGEDVPAADTMPSGSVAHASHAMHGPDPAHANMPGMLTAAQLAQLAAARGAAFDRLFLELMIRHHEGALTMVTDLLAAGGAQESSLFALAAEIESDQQMEIARMQRLLAGER